MAKHKEEITVTFFMMHFTRYIFIYGSRGIKQSCVRSAMSLTISVSFCLDTCEKHYYSDAGEEQGKMTVCLLSALLSNFKMD